MIEILTSPLVAQQSVVTHLVLVRTLGAVGAIHGPDGQSRRQLLGLANTALRIHQSKMLVVEGEVEQVRGADRLQSVAGPQLEPLHSGIAKPCVEIIGHATPR